MYTEKDHTFVICAYKENRNLINLINSLNKQELKSKIIITTSTPNKFITEISGRYNIPLIINQKRISIAEDWNFGYNRAESKLITIAHQDDYYEVDYLKKVLLYMNKFRDAIIAFTDYYEIRSGKRCNRNLLLMIKRLMNLPFYIPFLQKNKLVRKLILSVGDPINCPSVTFNREKVGSSPFDTKYKNSCDYMTWVKLSNLTGRFLYIPVKLMGHRIYEGSETTKSIECSIRKKEDLEIRELLMPKCIAKFINSIYAISEKSNKIK